MASNKLEVKKNLSIRNRKASHEYHFIDKYVAGIVLKGTEIKSLRTGKVSLNEAYCLFIGEELWVRNMHISPYKMAGYSNHEAKNDRKLLLTKKELAKLQAGAQDTGTTIVPTHLFINDRGLAKLVIALAKGKKLFDKRHDIREKDAKRELDKLKI